MEINEEEYRWHGLKGEIFIAGARITISIRTHVVHTHTHSESIPHHLTSRNTPAPCRDPIFVTRLSIHSPVQHVSQDVWTLESASSRVAINKPPSIENPRTLRNASCETGTTPLLLDLPRPTLRLHFLFFTPSFLFSTNFDAKSPRSTSSPEEIGGLCCENGKSFVATLGEIK